MKPTASNFRIVKTWHDPSTSQGGALCELDVKGWDNGNVMHVRVLLPQGCDVASGTLEREALRRCLEHLREQGIEYQGAQLHVVREHSLADIPATLRAMADSIEARNKEGGMQTDACVVVWCDAGGPQVSYTGAGEAVPNAAFLLQLGIARMVRVALGDNA